MYKKRKTKQKHTKIENGAKSQNDNDIDTISLVNT